jgi:hypothetical protein
MSLIVGIFALPLLLWSWLVGHNEEDGELATSLIAWLVLAALGIALWWWIW